MNQPAPSLILKKIRTHMEELRHDLKSSKTRISIKKFIQAVFVEVTTMSA